MWLVSLGCRHSIDGDLPRAYRVVAVPQGLLTSPDAVKQGGALFHKYCTLCHGVRGDGHGLQSEGLNPKPRDLTDPAWRQTTSPRHVFFAIREGVHGTAMPAWKGTLSESDSWALTAYVLSLSQR
jgi:high-affinity iron transporter